MEQRLGFGVRVLGLWSLLCSHQQPPLSRLRGIHIYIYDMVPCSCSAEKGQTGHAKPQSPGQAAGKRAGETMALAEDAFLYSMLGLFEGLGSIGCEA